MDKCRYCGSEYIDYKKEKKCFVCLGCGARFAATDEEAKQAEQSLQVRNDNKTVQAQPRQTSKVISDEAKRKQLRYFSFYKILPKIVMIVMLVAFCILGIAVACIIQGGIGAVAFFACAAGGGVVACICYLILKIACSHKLLQIHYLQKIAVDEKGILDD